MDPKHELEQEITRGLAELRELLHNFSTYSVAGCCFIYTLEHHLGKPQERLTSPAKQIPFLLAVLLSGREPQQAAYFGKGEWAQVKSLLEKLFWAYMLLYMPRREELGALTPEWDRMQEVSMLAFLHYFNSGLPASVRQVAERIKTYLVPFDSELEASLGVSATQALAVCHWISSKLEESLDDVQAAATQSVNTDNNSSMRRRNDTGLLMT